MIWVILWGLAWAGVCVARDWRVVPLLYGLLVALPVLMAMPMQNDLAAYDLASQPWEKLLTDQALLTLPWAGVGLVIWFFRRRPAND
jgi:hypothetical protein